MYFESKIKQMNRKNNGKQWPVHPTHITVQDIDNTAAFRSSQMTLGSRGSRQVIQDPNKWTFPLTLQKLQPYLMTIHTTLIKNLKRKLLQRQLTIQQEQLIQCSRHDKHLQQFISGILAIETCVKELTKEHTATVVSFMKATNLLLINYKFLYLEYVELKSCVRTSESLTGCEEGKSDGFMKFFDSLKFLALVIKNAFMEGQQGTEESREQQNTGSSLWDSWRYQLRKLQDLMSFQSILNMEKSSILGQNLKLLDQKLVSLHNQQQQIIISELLKQNNFLRWQVFSKDNTITEYEQSIYNVDLSRYRENEEREEYWARRVKFSRNGGCSNHQKNSYSQLLNDGSGISCHNNNQGKSQLNIIEEKILEPEEIQHKDELTKHLNILSEKMEQLQIENKTLRDKLKSIEQNHMQQNQLLHQHKPHSNQQAPFTFTFQPTTIINQKKQCKYSQKYSQSSHHTQSDNYEFERQKLDLLLKEIEEMKVIIVELEQKEVSNRELVEEKNAQIRELEQILEEKQGIIEGLNRNNLSVQQRISSLQETINTLKEEISSITTQLSTKTHQLQSKSLQLNNKSQQLQLLNTKISTLLQTIQLRQKQIISLSSEINSMNQQFAKQMEKYNTVFYKISQELSASLQKVDALEKDNLKLIQKNKRLQQDNVRKQAIIVNFQTRFVCTNNDIFTSSFGAHNNNPYVSNYNGNLTARKSSKLHSNNNINLGNIQAAQHLYSRQHIKSARNTSKTPLKQFQHPHDINRIQQLPKINHQDHLNEPHNKPQPNHFNEPLQIQSPTVHNHYHHYVGRDPLTPAKRLSHLRRQENRNDDRSKSPIDARDVSRKKITIKVQGNKLVNQIVQKKEPSSNHQLNHVPTTTGSDRKSSLMTRIQTIRNQKIEKQNHASPSFSQQNHKQSPTKSPKRQSSSPEFKKTSN